MADRLPAALGLDAEEAQRVEKAWALYAAELGLEASDGAVLRDFVLERRSGKVSPYPPRPSIDPSWGPYWRQNWPLFNESDRRRLQRREAEGLPAPFICIDFGAPPRRGEVLRESGFHFFSNPGIAFATLLGETQGHVVGEVPRYERSAIRNWLFMARPGDIQDGWYAATWIFMLRWDAINDDGSPGLPESWGDNDRSNDW